ncbi:hypothetical protein niasHT_034768 [Heterodera trifolii]|uniref:Uncharacterized protein n=1 Tax=Heterodera trifolii TaxID=157864 RepID=A0ABD2HWR4_9BILA
MARLFRFSPPFSPRFPIFSALLLLLALCFLLGAEAATWRMRTDKKAMRNALVRFGKRNAYRPAGEAFVGTADVGTDAAGAHLLRNIGMDDRQTQWAAFGDAYMPRRNLWLWPEE